MYLNLRWKSLVTYEFIHLHKLSATKVLAGKYEISFSLSDYYSVTPMARKVQEERFC